MRLGKDPFHKLTAWDTYSSDSIGSNNGNLVYGLASHRLLSAENVEIVSSNYRCDTKYAEEVNESFDAFVLPLANIFRVPLSGEMVQLTRFIRKLRIPVMMLSGGAQLPIDGDPSSLDSIKTEVREFLGSILDKSPTIAVRGAISAEYLSSIGFGQVEVVGCPSMTLLEPGSYIVKKLSLPERANVAYNIHPPKNLDATLVDEIESRHNATFFPQSRKVLELMLFGNQQDLSGDQRLPIALSHRQYMDSKAEFYLDAFPWIERLKDFDFSVGPRIHGNIVALLAGTPAAVIAHDSRTKELADYHNIPIIKQGSGQSLLDIYDSISFDSFNSEHKAKVGKICDFVSKQGFNHVFESGQEKHRALYDSALGTTCSSPVRFNTLDHESVDNSGRAAYFKTSIDLLQRRIKDVTAESRASKVLISQLESRLKDVEDKIDSPKTDHH
jgi:hypothetical protein